MKRLLVTILIVVAVLVAALGLAIALGGPGKAPPPMSSINDPFKNVDFSDLPEATYGTARDGTNLAFRAYLAAGDAVKGSVVFVHGSSASSSSMHLMAKGFAAAGYAAYTLDIRGHGKSGSKGHIAYIGQLEDDIEDFVHSTKLLSLPRSPDSLPAADLCFASRAVHVRNYSPTIFFFLLGSVRTQQRCVQAAAAGLPWGFRASSRSPC